MQGSGLLALALVPLTIDPNWLVPELALVGFGVGLFRSPNHRALFGSVPKDKMGQAGGYQHLPRQLGESIGETGVVTMFTTVVLAAASVAGVQMAQSAPKPTATPVPTAVAAPSSGLKPNVVIQPYAPAVQTVPFAGSVGVATVPGAPALDTNTADDTIVDVPDDSASSNDASDLSPAVTALPPAVQMNGYRLMWALAGLIALGGAGLSWFGRDEAEAED
jgi:hypothetical protein